MAAIQKSNQVNPYLQKKRLYLLASSKRHPQKAFTSINQKSPSLQSQNVLSIQIYQTKKTALKELSFIAYTAVFNPIPTIE